MADVLFISESTIKENTSVSNNVSPKLLLPYVTLAQEMHLKPVLGEELYDQVIDQISASTLTTANQTLVTRAEKTVVFYTLYEALPFIRTRIDQTGIAFMNDDTFEIVDNTTFYNLRETTKNYAESYMYTFRDWLDDNKDDYPLYDGCASGNTFDLGGFVF